MVDLGGCHTTRSKVAKEIASDSHGHLAPKMDTVIGMSVKLAVAVEMTVNLPLRYMTGPGMDTGG